MQNPNKLMELQKFRWKCKTEVFEKTKAPVLNLKYEETRYDPVEAIDRIVSFLGIRPASDQREQTIALVLPRHRHFYCK